MEVKRERLGIQFIQALELLSLCRAVELRSSVKNSMVQKVKEMFNMPV